MSLNGAVFDDPAPLACDCDEASFNPSFSHILWQYLLGLYMTPRNWCIGWSLPCCWDVIRGLSVMYFGVVYVAGLLMFRVNCIFSCVYYIGVHLLLLGAARHSMFSIPIMMLSKFSVMLCVIGGVSDSGVDVNKISMPISSKCCSRLRAQQFGVSAVGRCSGPPWDRLQCGCRCLYGCITSPVATLATSSD